MDVLCEACGSGGGNEVRDCDGGELDVGCEGFAICNCEGCEDGGCTCEGCEDGEGCEGCEDGVGDGAFLPDTVCCAEGGRGWFL